MNKRQKLITKVTEGLLKNEEWIYGRRVTSFCKMRKMVKKHELV